MIIAQITDTHLADAEEADPVFRARAENLRQCIVDINGLEPKPDAVIHTGDMTQHGLAAEFAHARALLAALEAPLYVTPGNRDGSKGMASAFAGDGYMKSAGAFVHYAVETHPVRLVSVDSLAADGDAKGDLCHTRLAALDATLAEAPARPTALFMHHPPFDVPSAPDPFAYQRRQAAADLAALVSGHPAGGPHLHRPHAPSMDGGGGRRCRQHRAQRRRRLAQGPLSAKDGWAASLPGSPIRGRLGLRQRDPPGRFQGAPWISETINTLGV